MPAGACREVTRHQPQPTAGTSEPRLDRGSSTTHGASRTSSACRYGGRYGSLTRPNEKRAIRADPTVIGDFTPYLSKACKIVGASCDAAHLQACEAAIQKALGAQATAIRSQTYYLDVTPPGCDKGTFVEAMAKLQGISTDAIATIGDMQNDLAMFRKSGLSVAMGNATDDVKKQATHVTTSNENEGFAGAIDIILKNNEG